MSLPSVHTLDSDQRRAIDMVVEDGSYLVKGEAGTGKSIVLAHAIRTYQVKHPQARMCVLSYTNALVALLDEMLGTHGVEVMTIHGFMGLSRRPHKKYDCVFIDEVQDMDVSWAKKIRGHAEKFVFFGDFGQSVYAELHQVISENELTEWFNVKAVIKLMVDHRLPRNHRALVDRIFLTRKLDSSTAIDRRLANAEVTLFHVANWNEEMAYVCQRAQRTARPGMPSAVIFEQKKKGGVFRFLHTVDPQHEKIDPKTVNDELTKHGVPFRFLGNGEGDLKEANERALTYVITWYSVKGLDFETVIIPNLSVSPCKGNPLYVALTRSTRNLILTYSGNSTPIIETAKACPFVRTVAADEATGSARAVERGAVQEDLF